MTDSTIRTERLVLRPWTSDDLDALHAIWSDPEVVWWGPSADKDASARLLDAIVLENALEAPGLAWYAVVDAGCGEIVGNVMLRPAPYAPGEVDVGWTFVRSRWGAGFATEAARAAIARGFALAPHPRVLAAIVPANERSIRVAARLGMRRAGAALHAGMEHDLYALDRSASLSR